MHKFFIRPNILKKESYELTKNISAWLQKHGKEGMVSEKIGTQYKMDSLAKKDSTIFEEADCAIVLGGDGSIISAARELAAYHMPILGVNLGHLGFLADVDKKDIIETLEKICDNHYFIEDRIMLQSTIVEGDLESPMKLALNDIVLARSSISRMVDYSIFVNDALVNHYSADGVIISTPTGSTAYNLSAGGPILAPQNEMMIITPICPHSLTARSLIISSKDKVSITFGHRNRPNEKDLHLTIDGQVVVPVNQESKIVIERSNVNTHLVKLEGIDFYTILRKKLGYY